MRQPTELMQSILTSETAKKIIDWVSPIYGNSYVGLWIFQAIGAVLDDVDKIAEQLLYETTPRTTELLIDYWERAYGITSDPSMSIEQRREQLISKKLKRGPCNPSRLAAAVSVALGGVEVDIDEHVDTNTFLVNVRDVVPSLVPAIAVLERMKPAHLVYQIRVATQTVSDADIKIAIAMTQAEHYRVEVVQ